MRRHVSSSPSSLFGAVGDGVVDMVAARRRRRRRRSHFLHVVEL